MGSSSFLLFVSNTLQGPSDLCLAVEETGERKRCALCPYKITAEGAEKQTARHVRWVTVEEGKEEEGEEE